MLKSELRIIYKEKRLSLADNEKYAFDLAISEGIKKFILERQCKKVHVFLPIQKWKEFNSFLLLNDEDLNHVNFYVPVVEDGEMTTVKFNSETLAISEWGIPEPKGDKVSDLSDLDMVIVPLLVCDIKGNRVGFGKGFYDRFFKSIPDSVKKVGVSYFLPIRDYIEVDDWDIALDGVFLPTGYMEF